MASLFAHEYGRRLYAAVLSCATEASTITEVYEFEMAGHG